MSEENNLMKQTARIVEAYVRAQYLPAAELPKWILSIHAQLKALQGADLEMQAMREEEASREPAVPVSESIQPDYIVCLEDGLRFKSMKRHLSARYGLTPDAYRKRWGLPADYPMVSPKYSERRRELAANR